ncbi:MAG: hypothetical protein ABI748_11750 [Dokdonella sp.]
MKRSTLVLGILGLASAFALAGCGGSNSNSSNTPPPPPPPPPPPATTSLTDFVHSQLAATSDTTQPVDINGITFTFPDDSNPAAFNDVTGGP